MKAASYNQGNSGHRKALCPGAPQGFARYHKWKVAWKVEVSHPERSPGLLLACHTEGTLLRVGRGSLSDGLETRAEKPRFIILAEVLREPQRLLGECGPSGSDWGPPGTSAGGGSEDGDKETRESSPT